MAVPFEYAFPVVYALDSELNVRGILRGGDLYAFDRFLAYLPIDTLVDEPQIAVNTAELGRVSVLLKGYLSLVRNREVNRETFDQVSRMNSERPGLISALLEAYYYKQERVYPERIDFIRDMLSAQLLPDSNVYFMTQQKLIDEL